MLFPETPALASRWRPTYRAILTPGHVCILRILYPRELSISSGRSRLDRGIAGMGSWTAVVNLMLAMWWDTGGHGVPV